MTKKCFVITPIGQPESPERLHADRVWQNVLKPVFESAGYELIRADKMHDPGQITQAVFKCISESEICLADISFLNPNVMYELGVRHCLRLPSIQIKTVSTINPFDTRNQRTIDFELESDESLRALTDEIKNKIQWIERNPGTVSNPLTAAIDLSPAAFAAERSAKDIQELMRRVADLERRLAEIGVGDASHNGDEEAVTATPMALIEAALQTGMDSDGVNWVKGPDGAFKGHIADFDVALRPQSKGRWSSGAVHSKSGYSVTYPTWQQSVEEARQAILAAMRDEGANWQGS